MEDDYNLKDELLGVCGFACDLHGCGWLAGWCEGTPHVCARLHIVRMSSLSRRVRQPMARCHERFCPVNEPRLARTTRVCTG